MPTLDRRLADTMTASAVIAEVVEHTLPRSGVTVRFRVLPHLEVVKAGAAAVARVTTPANRAARRADGQRGPLELVEDTDEGDAYLDALCKALAKAIIDDDGDPVFRGREAVAAWLNALHPDDFRSMLTRGGDLLAASALERPEDDTDEVVAVGKGSSRSGRTSSRSTTHASSSAASPPSSA